MWMGGWRIWWRRGDGIVKYDEEIVKIRFLKILVKNSKNGGYINFIFVKKKLFFINCLIFLICVWKWIEVFDKWIIYI